ncbi:MAG: GntR family transcriptional regulator [Pusillimonas sp.]|nr:GntR family transcriptional regulator [Pusillimonas sp.]
MASDNVANYPLTEQAYRTLRKAIVQCEFPPEERLRVDDLSARYGFSSSPIREALTRLAEQGLVLSIENRGFRVAPLSFDGLKDLTRVRLLIETEALKDAMENGDDEWEERIVAAYHSLRLAEQRISEGPIARDESWSERHRAFHLAIYSGCSSPLLLNLIDLLFDNAERYHRYSARFRKARRKKDQDHQLIMKAALKRDKHAAVTLLKKHIRSTEQSVTKSVLAINNASWKMDISP